MWRIQMSNFLPIVLEDLTQPYQEAAPGRYPFSTDSGYSGETAISGTDVEYYRKFNVYFSHEPRKVGGTQGENKYEHSVVVWLEESDQKLLRP